MHSTMLFKEPFSVKCHVMSLPFMMTLRFACMLVGKVCKFWLFFFKILIDKSFLEEQCSREGQLMRRAGSIWYLMNTIGQMLSTPSTSQNQLLNEQSVFCWLPHKSSVAAFKSFVPSFLSKFIRVDKLPLSYSLLLLPSTMYKEESCHLRGVCESEL